ncbi:MAG TPA: hypothetical protein VJ742_12800 [Nitrososphaera sp.]|nr:hypothetical protein [Nitrososphaera sp.]
MSNQAKACKSCGTFTAEGGFLPDGQTYVCNDVEQCALRRQKLPRLNPEIASKIREQLRDPKGLIRRERNKPKKHVHELSDKEIVDRQFEIEARWLRKLENKECSDEEAKDILFLLEVINNLWSSIGDLRRRVVSEQQSSNPKDHL